MSLTENSDRAAIADIIARFHRAIDEGDSATVRALMTDDAGLEVHEGEGVFRIDGADNIVATQDARNVQVTEIKAQHILGPLLVDIDGQNAQATAYQTVFQYSANALTSPINQAGTRNFYELTRTAGAWRVKHSRVQILWMTGGAVHT